MLATEAAVSNFSGATPTRFCTAVSRSASVSPSAASVRRTFQRSSSAGPVDSVSTEPLMASIAAPPESGPVERRTWAKARTP
ncbi:hypothetical protein SCYAM73S_05535 [Streptomyces cyaneofuscatus]